MVVSQPAHNSYVISDMQSITERVFSGDPRPEDSRSTRYSDPAKRGRGKAVLFGLELSAIVDVGPNCILQVFPLCICEKVIVKVRISRVERGVLGNDSFYLNYRAWVSVVSQV
jgi:hypothetical protein